MQEEVEGGDALDQPALDRVPFGGRDDARQQIVGKDAFGAARVAVDGEGDALVQEGEVGGPLPFFQLRRRQFEQALIELFVLRPRHAVGVNISS